MKNVKFLINDGEIIRNYLPLASVESFIGSGNDGSMLVVAEGYRFEQREDITFLVLKVGCETLFTPHDIYVHFPLNEGMNEIIYQLLTEIKAFEMCDNSEVSIHFDNLLVQDYCLHYAVVDNKVIFTSIQRCTDDIYKDNIGIQSSNLLEVVAMQYKLDK
jgi:hypothetical protein